MCFSVLSSFFCLQLLYLNILRGGESRSGGEVRGEMENRGNNGKQGLARWGTLVDFKYNHRLRNRGGTGGRCPTLFSELENVPFF